MAAEFLVVFTCNLLENTLEVGILWQEYLLNILEVRAKFMYTR